MADSDPRTEDNKLERSKQALEALPSSDSALKDSSQHASVSDATASAATNDRRRSQGQSPKSLITRRKDPTDKSSFQRDSLIRKLVEAVDEALEQLWISTGDLEQDLVYGATAEDLIERGRDLVEDLERGDDQRSSDQIRQAFSEATEILLSALMTAGRDKQYDQVVKVSKLTIRAYEAYTEKIEQQGETSEFGLVIPVLRMKRLAAEYEMKQVSRSAPLKSRHQGSATDHPLPRSGGIVVLVWAASPLEKARVLFDKEIANLRDLELRYREELRIEDQLATTRHDLTRSIIRHEPDIVHFSGHGEGESLVFHGRDDEPEEASIEEIERVFKLATESPQGARLRCVVFNACLSSDIAKAVSNHVDCVLGTPTEVGDDAALAFSKDFYEMLALAQNVDWATRAGVDAMKRAEPDFDDFPILFARPGVNAQRIQFITKKRQR